MQQRVEDAGARGHAEPAAGAAAPTTAQLGGSTVSGDPTGPELPPSLAWHPPTPVLPCPSPGGPLSPTWQSSECRRRPCARVPAMARLGSARPPLP